MSFRQKLNNGQFVYTVEVEPPKGVNFQPKLDEVSALKGKVDAFNVTDMQSSVMRMSSWAMCLALKAKGLEPILQLTCRDRNILALEGDLLGAYSLGIENVLLLTGDSPKKGDHPQAKAVFDVNSIGLIEAANTLNKGFDLAQNSLEGKTDLFIGAAANPFATNLDKEIDRIKEKIDKGVSFFQTQPVFEADKFKLFMDKIHKLNTKIIAGVIFLKSYRMAKYMNDNIDGINVPQAFMERINNASDKHKEAAIIAAEIIKQLKDYAAGVHIMPIGWEKYAAGVFSYL